MKKVETPSYVPIKHLLTKAAENSLFDSDVNNNDDDSNGDNQDQGDDDKVSTFEKALIFSWPKIECKLLYSKQFKKAVYRTVKVSSRLKIKGI